MGAKALIALLVFITLAGSAQAAPPRVRVPYVHGATLARAERAIRAHRLRVGRILPTTRTSGVPIGYVTGVYPRAGSRLRRGARISIFVAAAPPRPTRAIVPLTPPPPPFYYGPPVSPPLGAPLIAVGNAGACRYGGSANDQLARYGATWLRVMVTSNWETTGLDGASLSCVTAAVSAGYRVLVVIQWNNGWSPVQVADYVRRHLAPYAPYVSAVALGNEQELQWPPTTPDAYAADWRAAEPVVEALTPNAIRVGGEIGPWGVSFLQRAVDIGLPGVQVLAGHPYAATFAPGPFVAWANSRGLQVWFDEGLGGPGAWGPDVSLDQLQGAQVAGAWLGET